MRRLLLTLAVVWLFAPPHLYAAEAPGIDAVNRARIILDLVKDGNVATPASYGGVDLLDGPTSLKYVNAFCSYFGGPIDGTNAEKARFYINHMRGYHRQILAHQRKQTASNTAAEDANVEVEVDIGADETVMSNEPPTDVVLTNTVTTLPDDTDLTERLKVADIVVTDDEQGTNELSLSGDDSAMFEIDGTVLYLKAESTLDSVANPSLDVTIAVDDASVGSTPDDTTALAITITAA